MTKSGITLFSSDSRPKYVNDLFSVLALPRGTKYQFRYRTAYIPSSIAARIADGTLVGARALIAFRSATDRPPSEDFIVPARWARVVDVEKFADFYVIRFIVDGYPLIDEEFRNSDVSATKRICRAYLGTLSENLQALPVHEGFTDIIVHDDGAPKNDKEHWIHICRCLGKYAPFSGMHFVRLSGFSLQSGSRVEPIEGDVAIHEQQYLSAHVEYYADSFVDRKEIIRAETEDSVLRSASRKIISLNSRYDSTRFLVQARDVVGETRTEFVLETDSDESETPRVALSIPIVVRRSLWRRWLPAVLAVIGAGLVAAPGILGQEVLVETRLVLAFSGAILVGIGTVLRS